MEGDPLIKFDQDLEAMITSLQEDKWQLIIMGDFNQDMEGNMSITRLMEGQGLKNIIRERHGKGPPSRQMGSKVIDATQFARNRMKNRCVRVTGIFVRIF